MKKLIYEIPVHDDNDAEMIAREIEGVLGMRPARVEEIAPPCRLPEAFLSWAEGFFGDKFHRNTRLQRRDLYDAFIAYDPEQRKFCTATAFKRWIIAYCAYKGYVLNPQKYDRLTGLPCDLDRDGQPVIDDKSGGIEYFTVGDGSRPE